MGSWWRRVGDWLSRRTVATLVAVLAVTGDDGRVVTFDNLRGFAEETRNRW